MRRPFVMVAALMVGFCAFALAAGAREIVLDADGGADLAAWTGNWVTEAVGANALVAKGITGRGVKVGVFEKGCATNDAVISVRSGDGRPLAADSHGTGVANIIANRRYGIAPGAEIWIYTRIATAAQFESSVKKAVADGMDVINCSFAWCQGAPKGMGTYISEADQQVAYRAVEYAASNGVLIIAGNGNMPNNEAISIPAAHPLALSVGGTARSENGSAPLQDNWAHELLSFGIDVPVTRNDYTVGTCGGTSFATPVVTGIAALALEQDPDLTPDELKRLILDRAYRPDPSLPHPDRSIGMGYARAFEVGDDYVTQAQIDAERASFVRIASVTPSGAAWNAGLGMYEMHVPSNTPTVLVTAIEPANATDFVRWYVGNEDVVDKIGRDNLVCGRPLHSITNIGRWVITNNVDYGIITARDSFCTNVLCTIKVWFDGDLP